MSKSLVCEGLVVRFFVENHDEGADLTIAARSTNPERLYQLRFTKVVDLRFENPVDFEANIVLLAEAWTLEGWENIRYRVRDHERGFVSFYCEGIEQLA